MTNSIKKMLRIIDENSNLSEVIEAKNTPIKTVKRVSYGFKSFEDMKIWIFLMNGLIKMK